MGARRNLTLALDGETIRKAKLLAAQRDTSVTRLLADLVNHLVEDEERYEACRRTALSYLERGLSLGGSITARREEWHER